MAMLNRIGWQLVAGAGLISLVGCAGGGGGGTAPAAGASVPALSQQPADQTRPAGSTATFTVAATANGTLTYQWRKDGVALSGATGASYTTPVLTGAEAGVYTCQVTNTLGGSALTVLSSPASLVVNVAPAIATQPASIPAPMLGGSATFSVTATGNGTLSYQWQKNGVAIAKAANASAVTSTLTLTNLQASDSGTYTCVVTATLNGTTTSTTSAPAVLGVGQLATITQQPAASQTVVQGAPVSFTVAATPSTGATLSYQWRKDGVDLPAGNASALTSTLTLASAQGADAGTYTCAVTNTVNGTSGTLASANAVLAVNVPPAVSAVSNQTGGQGGTVTFAVAATGNGSLSYQWRKNGVDLTLAQNATARSASLVLANLQPTDADTYDCVVTNTLNGTTTTTTTSAANLGVNPAPAVTALVDQTQAEGGTATFTVAATGTGTLSYQWQRNGVNLDATANPSAATASLTLTALAASEDGAAFRCVVTDTVSGVAASTVGNAAILHVSTAPVFTTQVTSQGYTTGAGTASFAALATGNGTLTYQWYKGTPGSGVAVAAPQGTAATLALTGLLAGDDGSTYYCVATNTLNGVPVSTTSAVGTLVLNAAPTISFQPGNVTLTLGGVAAFSTSATGTGTLSYQWQKNGVDIPGATGTTYVTPVTVKADAGNTYRCVVTNTVGGNGVSVTTNAAVLALNWAPTFVPASTATNPAWGFNGADNTVRQGFNADMNSGAPALVDTATAPTVGTVAYTYQWYQDGTPISAGGNLTITNGTYSGYPSSGLKYTASTLANAGTFTCTVTRTVNGLAAASATSSPATLFVLATPVISAQPANVTVVQGTTATISITATAANGTLAYQWYKGTPGSGLAVALTPTNGANTSTLTLPSVKATDSGAQYYCIVTNKDTVRNSGQTNPVTSTAATLSVSPVVAVPVVSMDANIPANQTGLVASTQDQGPNVTYAWSMTGGTITSANVTGNGNRTITYTAPASGTVTATVTVTSTVDATFQSGSANATVKTSTFLAPDLVMPTLVHPSDNWMKAFTTSYPGETYTWTTSVPGGQSPAPTITVTPNNTISALTTVPFSVGANPGLVNLNVNGQLAPDNATTTTQVTVAKNVWVTKDGGPATAIGEYPTATTLPNGRVLITGGQSYSISSPYTTSAAAYIYDPATGRMVPTGAMATPRARHTATLLDNGTVLVAGGYSATPNATSGVVTTYLNTAEIWDPLTGTWSPVPAFTTARARHAAVKIGGKVALIGGTTNGSTATNSIQIYDPSLQSWASSTLAIARYNATAVILANDTYTTGGRTFADAGKVLIVGGTGGTASNNQSALDAKWQPEIWDGTTAASQKLGGGTPIQTKYPRDMHSATILRDGNILIAGSSATTIPTTPATSSFVPALTAEIFSPSTSTTLQGAFSAVTSTMLGGPLGATPSGRQMHTAHRLPDGSVLLAGGKGTGGAAHASTAFSTELFLPNGTTSAPTTDGTFGYGDATAGVTGYPSTFRAGHYGHAGVSLPSGQAVIVGGQTGNGTINITNLTELYTPVNGSNPATLTVPAGLDSGRTLHTAVRLSGSGRVMVIGGVSTQGGVGALNAFNSAYLDTVRIYDATTHTWISTGSLNVPRKDFAAVALANGSVLVTGGKTAMSNNGDTSAELWVPTANGGIGAWQLLPSMNTARALHSMVLLGDGRVLIMGGGNVSGGVKSCEIYSGGVFTALPSATGDLSEGKGMLSPVVPTSGPFAGQVVIAGGRISPMTGSSASAQVEVFNPATNSWNRDMTPLQSARSMHTTILLPSGKLVLIGGMTTEGNPGVYAGVDMTTAQAVAGTATETYDLTLNGNLGGSVTWAGSPTPYSQAVFTADGHRGHQAVLLTSGAYSGRVLVMGGQGASNTAVAFNPLMGSACEIYDPATDSFLATDPLPVPRRMNLSSAGDWNEFTATLLPNNDVLVVGGALSANSTHIYRP